MMAQNLTLQEFMVINFDPMLPYIYVPETIWSQYSQKIKTVFGVECNTFKGSCYFNSPCSDVNKQNADHNLEIGLNDIYGNTERIVINMF